MYSTVHGHGHDMYRISMCEVCTRAHRELAPRRRHQGGHRVQRYMPPILLLATGAAATVTHLVLDASNLQLSPAADGAMAAANLQAMQQAVGGLGSIL